MCPSTAMRLWWLRQLQDLSAQSFRGAHRGRVYVLTFIWVSVRACLWPSVQPKNGRGVTLLLTQKKQLWIFWSREVSSRAWILEHELRVNLASNSLLACLKEKAGQAWKLSPRESLKTCHKSTVSSFVAGLLAHQIKRPYVCMKQPRPRSRPHHTYINTSRTPPKSHTPR
jgi:hypothetical protein